MKMFFNHGIHRIHGMMVSLVLLFGVAVSAVAATEPGITVEARQRYPWNGLVDLKFTITGEIGTKYDTSFVAKDMVGGTNIAMKTIRKSNGVAAEEKEKLLPGTYNWVWDAAADLPKDFKCDRMTVTGTAESIDVHEKVQLWEDGPYWATRNIGAENPWDYGYYFWWGDTIGYKRVNDCWVASDGSSTNFSFDTSTALTLYEQYTELVSKAWIDGQKIVLMPNYDAANKHLGDSWRMPTHEEQLGLIRKCERILVETNGVRGVVFRGKGDFACNSVFFPLAGQGRQTFLNFNNYSHYYPIGGIDSFLLVSLMIS